MDVRSVKQGDVVKRGQKIAAVGTTVLWSAVVSFVAYKLVDLVIGLRVPEEDEGVILDEAQGQRVKQVDRRPGGVDSSVADGPFSAWPLPDRSSAIVSAPLSCSPTSDGY